MSILADIGGTFIRLAQSAPSGPNNIEKYKVEDFVGLEGALHHYCDAQKLEVSGKLRIATAGYEDGGVWKFVNRNKWIIDPAALKQEGWDVEIILNDFEAGVWALTTLQSSDIKILKDAPGAALSKCLLGPGTGLGFGYLHDAAGTSVVQKTHGGHMPVCTLSDEQAIAVQTLQRLKADNTVPVFENLVSGPGLYNIYAAQCLMTGQGPKLDNPEALLTHIDDPQVQAALRLFHEFLGLFAATAVVSGHAYGGLYLTGGVLEHLIDAGQFDFAHFEKWFCLEVAESVKRDLKATPIYHVTYPYPALKGLLNA